MGRLTTENWRAENLSAGDRYREPNTRTEYTVHSAILVENTIPGQDDFIVVVTTSGALLNYRPWTLLAMYVIDGRPAHLD